MPEYPNASAPEALLGLNRSSLELFGVLAPFFWIEGLDGVGDRLKQLSINEIYHARREFTHNNLGGLESGQRLSPSAANWRSSSGAAEGGTSII